MIKLIIAVKRRADLTPQQFREHLSERHAVLVSQCPATRRYVRKYVQSYALPDVAQDGQPRFDGAAELWFDDLDAMHSFFGDADYLRDVRPDESRFADLAQSVFFVTEERQVI